MYGAPKNHAQQEGMYARLLCTFLPELRSGKKMHSRRVLVFACCAGIGRAAYILLTLSTSCPATVNEGDPALLRRASRLGCCLGEAIYTGELEAYSLANYQERVGHQTYINRSKRNNTCDFHTKCCAIY